MPVRYEGYVIEPAVFPRLKGSKFCTRATIIVERGGATLEKQTDWTALSGESEPVSTTP